MRKGQYSIRAWQGVLPNFFAPLEKGELDNSPYFLDVSPGLLDESDGRGGGSTGCDQIIKNNNLIIGATCILMDLKRIRPIFEFVRLREGVLRKLQAYE